MSKKRVRLLKNQISKNYYELMNRTSKKVESGNIKGGIKSNEIWNLDHKVSITFGDIVVEFLIGEFRSRRFASIRMDHHCDVTNITVKKIGMENPVKVPKTRELRFLEIIAKSLENEAINKIDEEEEFFYNLENDIVAIEKQLE